MFLPGFCDQASSSPSMAAAAASASSSAASQPPFCARALPSGLPAGLFASPPASPPQLSAPHALGNLLTTCRSLHAALMASPTSTTSAATDIPLTPPAARPAYALTPPLAHTPSPMRLRLRKPCAPPAAAPDTDEGGVAAPTPLRRRIGKRTPPARGANKRRRTAGDETSGDEGTVQTPTPLPLSLLQPAPFLEASEVPEMLGSAAPLWPSFAACPQETLPLATMITVPARPSTPPRPTTPRRSRIAPEALPLGLARSDFHGLHAGGVPDDSSAARTVCADDVEVEGDGEGWSTEEDRMLVELVLEKLQLSRTDWQDCARSLGKKDRHSVGRRWRSLMLSGDVGLRPGARASRRSRIHGTWR